MTAADVNSWLEEMKRLRRFPFKASGPLVSPGQPTPDGMAFVGWDQNQELPAYRVARSDGEDELAPFTPMAHFPPPGTGGDYFVDAFSDAAIKARWREVRDRPETRARVMALAANIPLPHEFRFTGLVDARGRIDPHEAVDLRNIRRPGFFGEAPWREPIAEADGRTSVVEIAVPREPYEEIRMDLHDPIHLRGWYLEGAGIDDGRGGRARGLIVLTGGRSIETTAIQHPGDDLCYWDGAANSWRQKPYPGSSGRTEVWGAANWRNSYIYAFNAAGFDVLTLDKRGHGVSGGRNDSNTNEQAEDIFRALTAFETGDGLRMLTPEGKLLAGSAAAGRLLSGFRSAKEVPVFVSGASQGCMVTLWAMYKNFVGSSDFERPNPVKRGPYGFNVKGALLLAPFSSGLGYRPLEDSLVEAYRRLEQNVQMFPSSEILAATDKWPALFIGRGLWDFAESLEGSLEAYRRARGAKALVAVRGPHSENEFGADNIRYMSEAMVRFASAVLVGKAPAGFAKPLSIRDVVAAAPASWPPFFDRP